MDSSELEEIRSFITALLRERDDYAPFSTTESLVRAGRIDSLGVVKLVTFLEGDFGVDFTAVEFDPQRLDSVHEIAAVIEEYRRLR